MLGDADAVILTVRLRVVHLRHDPLAQAIQRVVHLGDRVPARVDPPHDVAGRVIIQAIDPHPPEIGMLTGTGGPIQFARCVRPQIGEGRFHATISPRLSPLLW